MTEWATVAEFREWTVSEKAEAKTDPYVERALHRARLNILSLCHRDPGGDSEHVQEALMIVTQNILLGADDAVDTVRARGLQSAQYGDQAVVLGQTQNPFITGEVLDLLADEISKVPTGTQSEIQFGKQLVEGDDGYDSEDDDDSPNYETRLWW